MSSSVYARQWLLLVAILLLLGIVIGLHSYFDHGEIDAREQDRMASQAEIVAINIAPQLQLANRVIEQIIKELPLWQTGNNGFKTANRQLEIINDSLIGIRPILVISADGTVVASSNEKLVGMNFAYREYFQTALKNPDPRIFHIAAPFKTVLDNFVISLFRVIPGPKGEFAGIVIVSTVPEYFSTLLDSVRYAPDVRATIVHGDGKIFVSSPTGGLEGVDVAKPGTFFMRHLQSGQLKSVFAGFAYSTDEGRMMSQRTIQITTPPTDKPLVVALSRDLHSIYAHWQEELYLQGGLFGVVSLIAVVSLFGYQRRQRTYESLIASSEVERKQAEQENNKLLQAVEQSPVSIVVTNRAGVIEYVNPSFTRITGYTWAEAVGQNPRVLKSKFTLPATYEELWRTIREGKIWRGVLCNRKKDGDLIWEEMSVSPIIDAAGDITHFVAVKNDVTERKILEDQLERHQSHLEELVAQRTVELSTALEAAKLADRTKDEFLANITHELRTPLSAVIGMAGLARGISSEPRQRDYLDKITVAGKHLNRIINDLLDLSKIAAGHMTFENSVFSLHDLILRGNSVMSQRASAKGVELVETIDDAVPDVLRGDPLRVEQILLNLVGNAIKFTASGRVEVRVGVHERKSGAARRPSSGSPPCSAGAASENRICLDIQVKDSGIGMQPEELERMFKPFSQADATMSRRFGGTGLGLSICKHLAEMMEGNISVTSQAGVGSTFRVKLWLGLAEAGELPPAVEKELESGQVLYQNTHVLVVDDQPFNRDVVEGLLTVVGIIPHLAKNGQEALDNLMNNKQAFDLVLMDIQMPIMDGLTATRAIRSQERFSTLPIIAMTAHTMAHEKEKCVAAGMNDHIGKPFNEAGFYQVLRRWISHRNQTLQPTTMDRPETTEDFLLLKGVDTRAGVALLQGNEARYRKWLGTFVAEMPATMALIRETLANSNTEPASMAVHTLKGRFGLLGMKELHPIAADLEVAIDTAESTSELLLNLEHGVDAMCEEIRNKLGVSADGEPAANALPDK